MSTRVKKIFPVIIALITASLFGIIVIQFLWLNNMVALRKEQVTHKITDATKAVADALVQFKEQQYKEQKPPFGNFLLNSSRLNTIGHQFTTNSIQDLFRKEFIKN